MLIGRWLFANPDSRGALERLQDLSAPKRHGPRQFTLAARLGIAQDRLVADGLMQGTEGIGQLPQGEQPLW